MAVDQHQHIQPPDPCCSFSWQPINPKWNTNQEIYQILCNARMHPEIFTNTVIERPASGTQLLFARHDGNWFKNDGYEWRRRKGGRLIREDHMDLKVNKQAVISAHYAHSAVVPSFHRRIYSLRNDPQYVLIHYLNTRENEADYRFLIDMTVDSLLANSLYPNSTQLAAQLAPIYRYSLENNIIQQVSEEIVNTLHSLQNEQVQHQQQAGSSHSTSSSNRHLERRNSCSSAFRKGLSSLALRRQPSTFSDSIDVNFAGLTPNSCSCGNERQPIVGTSGNHRNSLDVANLHNASSSPSGATTKSSNLDEESLCLQQSISGSPVPASQAQFSSNQTPITDITPISGSSKGGTKVLVIGSFFMKGHEYSVQFGERRVPARLVQVGVLSLFSPPSTSSRTVPLIVYCNNQQVSTSSEFTYMDDVISSNTDNLQNLLDRIQILLSALYPFDNSYNEPLSYVDESALLRLLERKSQANQNQRSSNLSLLNSNLPSRTVFHYAALLNYSNLIRFLLNLRTSFGYNRELNPLSRDVEGLTALHLAMRMGHLECAKVIIKECRESLDVLDDRGRTPGDLASDEKMRRLAEKQSFINVHDKSSKEDHVSPTELWVMTNGETVTREHLLLKERVPLQKSPMGEEPVSSFSMLSDADGNEGQPGNDRGNWRDDTPLHVEISMDTNVFVPDSPKMADLFEAVTSPGIEITDADRERMAQLAKQIIEAIPPRIKNQESMSLIEDDISNAFYHNHYNSPLLSQHGPNQVSEFDNFFDHEYSHHRYDHTDNSSSLSAQPSGSSFDHNRLHPNTTRDGSFSNESSRANTFESTSFDFDNSKDLGEFFNLRFDTVVDPLQQSLGNLKLTDGEQREVYEAAMIIQRAYREYRARSSSQRQADVERRAAVTIQSFYRRYKKFCYFKKLHNAAIVVQKHFRMKKNRDEQGQGDTSSALEVPEHPTLHGESIRIQIPQTNSTLALLREHRAATTIQHAYRGHRNRKRQAAARKIQKFMKENRQNNHYDNELMVPSHGPKRVRYGECANATGPSTSGPANEYQLQHPYPCQQQWTSPATTGARGSNRDWMPGSSSYVLKQM